MLGFRETWRDSRSPDVLVRTGIGRKRQLNICDPHGTRTEFMGPQTVDGKPTPP